MSKPTGRRNPPVATRFRKGQSGNPKGRPKARTPNTTTSAFDVIIDRMLTVTQGGVAREVTAEEALQHRTYQDAIAGSRLAQRMVLKWIEKRERYLAARQGSKRFPPIERRIEPHDPDNADAALVLLGIATPEPTTAWLKLEPWAVQAALQRRRGGGRLSDKHVFDIEHCTRNPRSLRWPRGTGE